MWFEALPPLFIIGTCLSIPMIVPYYVEKAIYGNPMRRDLCSRWTALMTERDIALTGDYRKTQGLEAIPDK